MSGTWGYLAAAQELIEQTAGQGFTDIVLVHCNLVECLLRVTRIAFACSSACRVHDIFVAQVISSDRVGCQATI